eukprot:scaffold4847_cov89-Cylindrotheca_fusiformis.AAC.2
MRRYELLLAIMTKSGNSSSTTLSISISSIERLTSVVEMADGGVLDHHGDHGWLSRTASRPGNWKRFTSIESSDIILGIVVYTLDGLCRKFYYPCLRYKRLVTLNPASDRL